MPVDMKSLLLGPGSQGPRADAALLALRLLAGPAFTLHGWGKVRDVPGFADANQVPVLLGGAAAYVQFLGGVLLLLGVLVPLAALGIGTTMLVAVFMLVQSGEPFINPGGHSWESAALYTVLMACFVATGGGRFSLDHRLLRRTLAHQTPRTVEMPR
jgi:putative oxidoreductase